MVMQYEQLLHNWINPIYYVFQILPQICTANHAAFPVQMYALTFRFAVISEAPGIYISKINCFVWPAVMSNQIEPFVLKK